VTLAASVAEDEEWRERAKAHATAETLAEQEPATGAPTLAELLRDGTEVVAKLRKWLGITGDQDDHGDLVWEEPEPLPGTLPPVDAFDPAMLPEPLRAWAQDVAERLRVPMDFTAVAAVIVAATIVGRKVGIHPKHLDDWLVVANLWGGVVARPSQMKSPALAEMARPLDRLVAEAAKAFEQAEATYEAKQVVAEVKKDALVSQMKKAAKEGNETELARLSAELAAAAPPDKPTHRRYRTSDSTTEMLGVLLAQNPNGLLLFRDELSGWLASLDRQGREGDRELYLEAWNGTTDTATRN
jgi:hypothetical protein